MKVFNNQVNKKHLTKKFHQILRKLSELNWSINDSSRAIYRAPILFSRTCISHKTE